MLPTEQALKQVGRWRAVAVQPLKILVDLLLRPAELVVLVSQHLDGIGVSRQFGGADRAEEGCGISAVVEPVLLLPTAESWRAPRKFFGHPSWNALRHAPANIRETGIVLRRTTPVRNAPRTDLASELFLCENRTGVDEPSDPSTDLACGIGLTEGTSRHRIRVVFEGGQPLSESGHRRSLSDTLPLVVQCHGCLRHDASRRTANSLLSQSVAGAAWLDVCTLAAAILQVVDGGRTFT